MLCFHIYITDTKRGVFVHTPDNEFFEAYKRLDRLCSDIYGCHNGVSRYIEDMNCTPYRERFAVSSWERTYKTLKHLRWVRNQLAHESGQIQICEECDIRDINRFYDDILSGRDPLTQLRRYRENHNAAKKSPHRAEYAATSIVSDYSDSVRQARRIGWFAALLILSLVLAAIIYAIVCFN